MSEGSKSDAEIVAGSQGPILTLVALLFALKVSLFGALYAEYRNAWELIMGSGLCTSDLDLSNLKFFNDEVVFIIYAIDWAIAIPSIVMLLISLGILRNCYILENKKWNKPEVLRIIPPCLVFVILSAFAYFNSGASGYMSGMLDAFIDGAPSIEAFWKENSALLCAD